LNNPLKYSDPSGYKWRWGNPFYHFQKAMQWVNDNTTKLRQKMSDANIPDFTISGSVILDGNVNARGEIMGQEVFNTANIDRSNAVPKVSQMLGEVRQNHGDAWMEASYGPQYNNIA
jgi:hypothetical protein